MPTLEFLRSFRIFEMAIFDLVVSYLGIWLLSPFLIKLFKRFRLKTTKTQWLWLVLPLSIIIHLAVGQETALTRMIFDPYGNHLAKAIVLLMVFMALKKK